VPFLDELCSGIAPVSTPDIATSVRVDGGTAAGAMIVAYHALALFVEAPLLAWSERISARWFSAASLAVVALSAFAAAAFPTGWTLFLALAVYGPASGCALAVAEAVLIESNSRAPERTLARLAIAANAGDLAVPVLLAALSWGGYGWRTACVIAGVLAFGFAIAHGFARTLDRPVTFSGGDGADAPPTVADALRTAFGVPSLLAWSFACTLTNLLDEVLVAFSAVHLHHIGATAGTRSIAVALWVVGGFVGATAVERTVDRFGSRAWLLSASLATAAGVATLALSQSPWVATSALFVIGTTGTTLHPLAKARAYSALPGRPALVNAVSSALLLFDMAAPVALGWVASRAGSAWALAGLLVAPIGVGLTALRFDERD